MSGGSSLCNAWGPTFFLSLSDLLKQVGIGQVHDQQPKPWFCGLVPALPQHLNQHSDCLRLKGLGPGGQIGLVLAWVALPNSCTINR